MKTKSNKEYNAFTLIEVMAIMAIMSIMAVVTITSFASSRNTARLQAAEREVASAVKQAQSFALQGKTQSISGELKAPSNYSLRFVNATTYSIRCGGCAGVPVATFTLPQGVTISSPSNFPFTALYFTVPHGEITPGDNNLPLTFTVTSGSVQKQFSINRGGTVTEDL